MKHDDQDGGRMGRGVSGDAGYTNAGSTHGGTAPGKRTATQDARTSDPTSALLRRFDAAEAMLATVTTRHLPATRAAIDARDMSTARTASAALTAALMRIDEDLRHARRWATLAESEGALAMLAPLEAARDALRAEAAPVLALAPPPAPAPPMLSEVFDPANPFGLDPDHDAAEAAARETWGAQLDAAEEPAGGQVIDARDRFGADVQRRATDAATRDAATVQQHAAAGVAGTGGPLPHREQIQASFGAHDVSGVRAHVGGAAAEASTAIGAEAYATGNDVAFADQPSLFVAAHEAAHVVQQRAGVSLLGGVGEAGDMYEQHADAVAAKVVRGESAEALLGERAAGHANVAVQRKEEGGTYGADPEYTYTGDDEKQHGSNEDWENLDFEEVLPGEIGPDVAVPISVAPLVGERVRFVIGKVGEDESTGRSMAIKDKKTMIAGVVAGPEVTRFYDWVEKQGEAVTSTRQANKVLGGLVEAGMLDADFNLVHEKAIDKMLGRLEISGRKDSYAEGMDHSEDMQEGARDFAEEDIDMGTHLAKLEELGDKSTTLEHQLHAATKEIEAFDRSADADAVAGEKAAFEKEIAETLKWINLGIDLTTTVGGGAKGIVTMAGVGAMDRDAAGFGVLNSIAGIAFDIVNGDKLDALDRQIGALRAQASSAKRESLVSTLDSVRSEIKAYQKLAKALLALTEPQLVKRQATLSGFGSKAADALSDMDPTAPGESDRTHSRDPYAADDPESKQRIQTLFANLTEFEAVQFLLGPAAMPAITGEIPLSGFLANFHYEGSSDGAQDIPGHLGVEAAKLRWWSGRAANIGSLISKMREAIAGIASAPKDR